MASEPTEETAVVTPSSAEAGPDATEAGAGLQRGLGLLQAVALNVSNMIGIGPFITIPLFIKAMEGPHALVVWVAAAVLCIADGLVWSELGAALPGSGGTYHFHREIFGRLRRGRIVPFLFVWQFMITGAMELASGYVGAFLYLRYLFPDLEPWLAANRIPGGLNLLAALSALAVTALVDRGIRAAGFAGVILAGGTILTVLAVIIPGVLNMKLDLLRPEAGASFAPAAVGAAMLIAIYDYLGYYNICHLGDEVRDPGRTIPRAVIISVCLVAAIYLTMNAAIIGVIPWREAMESGNIAALFMERLYGPTAASILTVAILWTVVACVFAMTLGYSRIPFAAARAGDFFGWLGVVNPTTGTPRRSLWTVGSLTAVCCLLPLDLIVAAAVVIRIPMVFLAQIVGLHLLRTTRPEVPMPFRAKLHPLPSIIAGTGWLLVFLNAERTPLLLAGVEMASGALFCGVLQLRQPRRPAGANMP
jgi:amino acid transporter